VLGSFLEISVCAADVAESLAFYESLGFVQATTGDVWAHPYAVVTDGRLFLGLRGGSFASPSLTWVQPDLAQQLPLLRAQGVEFEFTQLGDDVFNAAGFRDPHGQMLTLLEARTFSPPTLPPALTSACGDFAEYALPVREFEPGRTFWESHGFVAIEADHPAFARLTLTSDRINLGLYRSRSFGTPVLTFESPDMGARIAALRDGGFAVRDRMPDALDERVNGTLDAPEGTRLLLLEAD
jgi:hypothetical protein